MFMVKAIFWIAVVALLMPRGPDLGLGAGGMHLWPGQPPMLSSIYHPVQICEPSETTCKAGLDLLDHFQAVALIGLARVKAEIEEQKRAREHANGA